MSPRRPASAPTPWADRPRRKGRLTAGDVLHAHLATQLVELRTRDPQARRDLPDGVHRMRVATRRLRSALATFRPLLDRTEIAPLRQELTWLAKALGAPRDAEVMLARLRALVAQEPPELLLGNVMERLDSALGGRHRAAHADLVRCLDGERYQRLLNALDSMVADPPFLAAARGAAAPTLARLVRRTLSALDRSMVAADQATPGPHQDELFHQVRKDAKRARYAVEAVGPVFGGPARRLAAAIEGAQETLGAFQDSVVTREVLRELGAQHLAGENSFSFGRLHALEQQRAEQAATRWPEVRRSVSRPRLRRWLAG